MMLGVNSDFISKQYQPAGLVMYIHNFFAVEIEFLNVIEINIMLQWVKWTHSKSGI
jgi:hypothetical protein